MLVLQDVELVVPIFTPAVRMAPGVVNAFDRTLEALSTAGVRIRRIMCDVPTDLEALIVNWYMLLKVGSCLFVHAIACASFVWMACGGWVTSVGLHTYVQYWDGRRWAYLVVFGLRPLEAA